MVISLLSCVSSALCKELGVTATAVCLAWDVLIVQKVNYHNPYLDSLYTSAIYMQRHSSIIDTCLTCSRTDSITEYHSLIFDDSCGYLFQLRLSRFLSLRYLSKSLSHPFLLRTLSVLVSTSVFLLCRISIMKQHPLFGV